MNEHFSLTRLRALLWADLVGRYRTVAMVSAVFAGLMLVNGLFAANSSPPQSNIFIFWVMLMLFVWGPIAASWSFKELHDKTMNEAYLLLPASALEKVVSRLLLVTVGFAVYVILFTNVVSWVNAGLNAVLFGREGLIFPFFSSEGWLGLALFLVNQSCYFLGAAWFRKLHFIKTALVLTFGPIVLVVFALFVFRIFFPELANWDAGPDFDADPDPDMNFEGLYQYFSDSIDPLIAALLVSYFVVIPLFCWTVAWMRVREAQVSHGI